MQKTKIYKPDLLWLYEKEEYINEEKSIFTDWNNCAAK